MLSPTTLKRFRGMCYVVLLAHSKEVFPLFLDYIHCIGKTQKTKFTIDSGDCLENLDF